MYKTSIVYRLQHFQLASHFQINTISVLVHASWRRTPTDLLKRTKYWMKHDIAENTENPCKKRYNIVFIALTKYTCPWEHTLRCNELSWSRCKLPNDSHRYNECNELGFTPPLGKSTANAKTKKEEMLNTFKFSHLLCIQNFTHNFVEIFVYIYTVNSVNYVCRLKCFFLFCSKIKNKH